MQENTGFLPGPLKPHFGFHLCEAADSKVKILLGMAGAHLGADAGFALGHHRVGEAHHIDALFQHPVCKLGGYLGVVKHDGDDGMGAFRHVEAQLAQLLAEVAGVFMDLSRRAVEALSISSTLMLAAQMAGARVLEKR